MYADKENLKKEQLKLSQKIILRDEFEKLKLVAGVDQVYIDNNTKMISAIVVCDYKTLEIVEKAYSIFEVKMPYMPGFLGFREGPAIVDAFSKLQNRPDVLIVDGNGILHPRKCGIASQIGLMLNVSTIGISKNLICGKLENGKVYLENDFVGIQAITKEHGNPLFVSPGHKITIGTSLDIVQHTIKPPHKLPEPLHLAHKYAKSLIKQEIKPTEISDLN